MHKGKAPGALQQTQPVRLARILPAPRQECCGSLSGMVRVRLAAGSVPEPLCSLCSCALVTDLSCPLALGNSSHWALMGSLEGLVGAGCHPAELWLLAHGPAKFCSCLGARSSTGKCVQVRISLSLSVSPWDALGHQPSSPARSLFLTICQLGLWPSLSLGSQFPGVFPFLQLHLHPWEMGKLC